MSTLLVSASDATRAGSVWEYLSASRLNLWLRCPLAHRFRYVDGVRVPTTPSLFLGQAVHHGLELVYRHRQLGIELSASEILQRLHQSWPRLVADADMTFTSIAEERDLQQQAERLVGAYLDQLDPDEPLPLAVETRLEAPLIDPASGEDLGMPLVGILDLVLPSETGAVIVDFKTAGSSQSPLEISHEVQLGCYSYLLRATTGLPEGALEIRSLVKTKVPQVNSSRFAPRRAQHLRRLFAVIREYLDALDRQLFNYRPGWHCRMCEFRERCSRAAA